MHQLQQSMLMLSQFYKGQLNLFLIGSVRVYDLPSKQLLCHSQYTSGGSSLIWAPVTVDPSATTIFAGFTDGVIRSETKNYNDRLI